MSNRKIERARDEAWLEVDAKTSSLCTLTRRVNSKHRYQVLAERRSLALYLAWEFGMARGARLAKIAPAFGVVGFASTRDEAERAAGRIREAAIFQLGRLGKPLRHSNVFVERRPGK